MNLICEVNRGSSVESTHHIIAVVVDELGRILFSSGEPSFVTCFRSALKPFQASSSVEIGATDQAGFSEDELALICASHNGEDIHTNTAQSMLNKLGLTVDDYECGVHPPYEKQAKHNLIKCNTLPTALHNNCSGKHAGMLCLGKFINNTKMYIELNHPVQKAIFNQIEKYANTPPVSIGVDGCSVPTPFFDMFTMAKMYQTFASLKHKELSVLYNAMTNHPYLVGGKNRFDTDFITAMNGRALSKVGGEAVQCVAIQTKQHGPLGMAFKVVDGNMRALAPSIISTMKHLDIISETELQLLRKYQSPEIKNHNKILTGTIRARIS